MSGEKQPVFAHQRRKPFQDLVLRRLIEIDHDVATEKHVERPSNRPVRLKQIEALKRHQPPKFRLDRERAALGAGSLDKKTAESGLNVRAV